jgi:hypothetical protein
MDSRRFGLYWALKRIGRKLYTQENVVTLQKKRPSLNNVWLVFMPMKGLMFETRLDPSRATLISSGFSLIECGGEVNARTCSCSSQQDPSYFQRDASQIHSDLMQRIKECPF